MTYAIFGMAIFGVLALIAWEAWGRHVQQLRRERRRERTAAIAQAWKEQTGGADTLPSGPPDT